MTLCALRLALLVALAGVCVGAMVRHVLPAGTVLEFVAFAALALPLALLWAWFCWWWLVVRS